MIEKILKHFGYVKEQPKSTIEQPKKIYFKIGHDIEESIWRKIGLMPFEGQLWEHENSDKYITVDTLGFVPHIGDQLTLFYGELWLTIEVKSIRTFIGQYNRYFDIDCKTIKIEDNVNMDVLYTA